MCVVDHRCNSRDKCLSTIYELSGILTIVSEKEEGKTGTLGPGERATSARKCTEPQHGQDLTGSGAIAAFDPLAPFAGTLIAP
jgi:hypothetical protein